MSLEGFMCLYFIIYWMVIIVFWVNIRFIRVVVSEMLIAGCCFCIVFLSSFRK